MDKRSIFAGIVAFSTSFWIGLHPMVQLLLILMVADIATGILAAAITKVISSEDSYKGLAKKAFVLIILALAHYLTQDQFGIVAAVAGFYCSTEVISIIENAKRAGIPLPEEIIEKFKNLRDIKNDTSDKLHRDNPS